MSTQIEIQERGRGPFLLAAAIILILAGMAGFFVYRGPFAGGESEVRALSTVSVARTTIRSTVTTSGVARAVDQTALRFAIPGRVSEVLVKLGDPVQPGQPLARLESAEDLANKVATAEANLASAQIKLRQIQEGASAADLASAEQAVATAQATVEKAEDDLEDLLDGPSAPERAAAEQAVASAESALASARASLERLTGGPSEAELTSAELAVTQAEANLTEAEEALADAEDSREAAFNLLKVTYEACTGSPLSLSLGSTAPILSSCEDDLLGTKLAAYNYARSTYESADSAVDAADRSIGVAEEALASAEESLEELEEGPDPADVAAAEAAVTAAEQALTTAQLELQDLLDGPPLSQVSTALNAVRSAYASLDAAIARRDELLAAPEQDDLDLQVQQVRLSEIALEQARQDLDDATLVAPFAGTVAAVDIVVGDFVGATNEAMTLLTPGALKVELSAGETDLPVLRTGQGGVIRFDAIQEKPFPIVVTAIGLAPQVQQGIVTYNVEAAIIGLGDDPATRPVPGMNGTVVIVTQQRADVLAVPSRAIRRRGEDLIVEVMMDGERQARAVETGLSDGDNTEIISGLSEGELVVLPGLASEEEVAEEEEAIPEGIR